MADPVGHERLVRWADDLRDQIHTRRLVYEQQIDQDDRRHQAAAMIGDLVRAMQSIGGVPDGDLLPLKDCLMMFVDLERGRRHPWSRPTNFGGTNSDNTADGELRLWVTMARAVLDDAGEGIIAADRRIVGLLAETGRNVSEQTIKKWRLALNAGNDPREAKINALRTRFWTPVRCIHGHDPLRCTAEEGRTPCKDGVSLARQFAEWAIKTPNFRDRLFSAS